MNKITMTTVTILVCQVFVAPLYADVAPFWSGRGPRHGRVPAQPYRGPTVSVVVRVSDKIERNKLIIPRRLLALMTANEPSSAHNAIITLLPFGQGAMLGLALVLLGMAGVALRRRLYRRSTLGFVMSISLLVCLTSMFMNPPATARQPLRFPPPLHLQGDLDIEVVDQGDTVQLILKKDRGLQTISSR